MNRFSSFVLTAAVILTGSCMNSKPPVGVLPEPGELGRLYILNEGVMGMGNSSIDFYDFADGTYVTDAFPAANPDVTLGLGDTGNDLAVYGGKLWAVMNGSDLVEVMDASTMEHIRAIDVPVCRDIAFSGRYAYVTSWAGNVSDDGDRTGMVYRIDINSLSIAGAVEVGYQPEDIAALDGKIYVANSGGYRFPDYDTTISVIDLETFEVTDTIEVAINLHRMAMDRFGCIYVSSRGNYYDVGGDVYVIDSKTDTVIGNLGIAASEMCVSGDSIYMTSVEWNYTTNSNTVSYTLYDVTREEVVSHNFIADGTDKQIQIPYGIAVNPETKEIFISDAKDYVTPGTLYCFSPDGYVKWQVTTGDIPAHFAFTTRSFQ